MNIQTLKSNIESKTVNDNLLIFKVKDNTFLAYQYINEIANIKNKTLNYIAELTDRKSMWEIKSNTIDILSVDLFDVDASYKNISNTFIICKEIDYEKINKNKIEEFIVEFPKLEEWQIKDYISSLIPSFKNESVDHIYDICKGDIYRIQLEIDRILLMKDIDANLTFNRFKEFNIYQDLSDKNVFDLINAIIRKDKDKVLTILKEKQNIDIDVFGIITLLYKNIKNILCIQTNSNINPEALEITSKQLNAIRYNNLNYYSSKSLYEILKFLLQLEAKIKSGELDTTYTLDYIVTRILSYQ